MKICIGDTLRTTRDLSWKVMTKGEIVIPAGTVGHVFPWETPTYGKGCAIGFEGVPDHPVTKYYPMALHRPGLTDYPDSMELVKRAGERMAA